jgi:nucleoside-diphosphate-sugar epimerase
LDRQIRTGGVGFIGSHLVELLTEASARVTVFGTLESGERENLAGVIDDVTLFPLRPGGGIHGVCAGAPVHASPWWFAVVAGVYQVEDQLSTGGAQRQRSRRHLTS